MPPPVTCASAFTSACARSARTSSRYSRCGASTRSASKSSSPIERAHEREAVRVQPARRKADDRVAGCAARAVDQRRRGRRGRRRCRRSRARRRGRRRAARRSRRRSACSPRRGRPRPRPRRGRRPARARCAPPRRSRGGRAASAPLQRTSLMQCAARSMPPQRSVPARRCSRSFEPTLSVDAASRRRSSSGKRPAKWPKPGRAGRLDGGAQPLDDGVGGGERDAGGLVRLRSVLGQGHESTSRPGWTPSRKSHDFVTVSDTRSRVRAAGAAMAPAAEACPRRRARRAAPAGPAGRPGTKRTSVSPISTSAPSGSQSSTSASAAAFASGIVRLQVQLREPQPVAALQQLVDPVARRVELEPVAGVRRDERPPAAVLLHAQLRLLGPGDRALELVLVEREPEVVDARQRPLARLHDDVDRARARAPKGAA